MKSTQEIPIEFESWVDAARYAKKNHVRIIARVGDEVCVIYPNGHGKQVYVDNPGYAKPVYVYLDTLNGS